MNANAVIIPLPKIERILPGGWSSRNTAASVDSTRYIEKFVSIEYNV
jgi:hypothetical protein